METPNETIPKKIVKGLENVIVDETAISTELPEEQLLLYRGYSVGDLARNLRYLDVVWLLWRGELPSEKDSHSFDQLEKSLREPNSNICRFLDAFPLDCQPMDVIRTSLSYLGSLNKTTPTGVDCNYSQALYLLTQLPYISAHFARRRQNLSPLEPRPDLDFPAHVLYLHFGREFADDLVRAFESALILYAENAFAPSTFTARVVASSKADLAGALTAAIASLKGPLHGGANELVMRTLLEIQQAPSVASWLETAFREKKRIMGFGHRIFRQGDPRVEPMKEFRNRVATTPKHKAIIASSAILEELMREKKSLLPNIDFPAGPLFYFLGFPLDLFTPLFAISRMAGWSAHIFEQQNNNRLYNPLGHYTGQPRRELGICN